jgi:hypothetical protein
VGSAQNAALEMKHEIAAVRLLQFDLTAANLRYAVMRAVELAELAELMTGDAPNEEDEEAEAGGSVEEREVARELSLKSHEAHALVLARIPSEARCKIKLTHFGGVKVSTWAADGATSPGAPVISGASGSRVVVRWSAAAANRSVLGPTAGSARRPSFGVGELARLLHTLVDPRIRRRVVGCASDIAARTSTGSQCAHGRITSLLSSTTPTSSRIASTSSLMA